MKISSPEAILIRYSKCARQTFIVGGASAAGRMKVYYENMKVYFASSISLSKLSMIASVVMAVSEFPD